MELSLFFSTFPMKRQMFAQVKDPELSQKLRAGKSLTKILILALGPFGGYTGVFNL